ncbi:MAG: nitrite/sulfite reductase [Zoogloeaceae bacterium]|jgi:sulfite reductase (NADPH) hemoprotein beta-component|nr:nitrite/sulfite reductase [Zoogloeaceae bacterium]
MYRYDDYDTALVVERVAQFRDQVARWQAGELTEDEFRPLRLQNGLYVQRQAPMLRIAVPYGMLSSAQLRSLAYVARRWDKGYGHFTTRHNLQFNWLKIEDCPDILAHLAQVNMHAIQTSGNCIRNITTDPFAGIAPDEVINPLPLAEILRQWSTFHPEFAFLPRKFKIAISGAREDRILGWFNDIGLRLAPGEEGEPCFSVIAGGGLGRTPVRGKLLKASLPWRHILTYLEAILRVFNLHGRRDNLYKARLKILVEALGLPEFTRQVEAEWQCLKDGPATITQEEYDRVAAHFHPPAYRKLPQENKENCRPQDQDREEFARWRARAVHAHKQPGYAAVTLSLKSPGQAPGDITAEQMEAVADLADRFGFGEARSSQEQNLILPDVERRSLFALWEAARAAGLATPNVGLLTDVVCCPGGELCDLANARSVPVANAIQARFADLDRLFDLGDLRLNISGCINACSHHHVGHIGILGVEKNNAEYYQITLGGRSGNAARTGEVIGPSFAAADIPDVLEQIIGVFVARRAPGETFLATFDRIGLAPFKERVYADHAHGTGRRRNQLETETPR